MDDVIVVGGRCAGAPVAMLFARAGLNVRLLERATALGDVVSGHMIKSPGVLRLARWGLLDAVLSTGCSFLPGRSLWVDGAEVVAPPLAEGVLPPVAPRRTALDPVLLDAARDAGAVVQMGTTVTGVVRDGERVVGVETPSGQLWARLVVGADGRGSRLAKLVGAQEYWFVAPVTYSYYTYWMNVDVDRVHAHLQTGCFAGLFPTNDDAVLVFYQAPRAGFENARRDPQRSYREALQSMSAVAEQLRGGTIRERLRGTGDLPNFLRTSAGPGWVLAGDAGHHKDPLDARGIADAFRDADLITAAALGSWDNDLDEALAAYPMQRDACAFPLAQANASLARLDHDSQQLAAAWSAMAALEHELDNPLREPAAKTVLRHYEDHC